MWHEARKQEKKLRGIIVDYRKRAERRREFYEKFKADPTQFIQIHGRSCKIHMDPSITSAAEKSLIPWPGNSEITIDRCDVRAHLDYIPETNKQSSSVNLDHDVENVGALNYERYRILVQNDLTNTSEDKFLHQIHLEEQYGTAGIKESKSSKHSLPPKAAIAYNYDDTPAMSMTPSLPPHLPSQFKSDANEQESDEDVDFDLLLNLNDLNTLQKVELNNLGTKYGLKSTEFMTYLTNDISERENLRLMKIQEEEKQHLSGRKARRERRAYKDRHLIRRETTSPPSYAASEPLAEDSKKSSSESDSSDSGGRVQYITSFGAKPSASPPFGPSLPTGYHAKRYGSSRRRRRKTTSSSSSTSEGRRAKLKKSRRKTGKKRRSRSSSSSSSSSSTSSQDSSHKKNLTKSPSPELPIRRYYGRRKSSTDSESDSTSSDDEKQETVGRNKITKNDSTSSGGSEKVTHKTTSKIHHQPSGSGGDSSTTKLTPQERLKRRMQNALNKQLKADKEAEKLRLERLEQERLEREDRIREISIKHRKKERERRHCEKEYDSSDSHHSRMSRSRSSSSSRDT